MALSDNAALNLLVELLNGGTNYTPPYKEYAAKITQEGTGAPVATVLHNSLGGEVTFDYQSSGYYTIDCEGLFTLGKTVVMTMFDDSAVLVSFNPQTANFIDMNTSGDTVISNAFLSIRVYY